MKCEISKKDGFCHQLVRIIFRVSFVTFLVLFIIEAVVPGFVTSWFNPIWLLIVAVVGGIIVLL